MRKTTNRHDIADDQMWSPDQPDSRFHACCGRRRQLSHKSDCPSTSNGPPEPDPTNEEALATLEDDDILLNALVLHAYDDESAEALARLDGELVVIRKAPESATTDSAPPSLQPTVAAIEKLIAEESSEERDNQLGEIIRLMAALGSVCQIITHDDEMGMWAEELGRRCQAAIYE